MPSSSISDGKYVIAPTYKYDPEGIYADPHIQAWARYYAEGGTDPSGAIYFHSVPGITNPGKAANTMNSETVEVERGGWLTQSLPSPSRGGLPMSSNDALRRRLPSTPLPGASGSKTRSESRTRDGGSDGVSSPILSSSAARPRAISFSFPSRSATERDGTYDRRQARSSEPPTLLLPALTPSPATPRGEKLSRPWPKKGILNLLEAFKIRRKPVPRRDFVIESATTSRVQASPPAPTRLVNTSTEPQKYYGEIQRWQSERDNSDMLSIVESVSSTEPLILNITPQPAMHNPQAETASQNYECDPSNAPPPYQAEWAPGTEDNSAVSNSGVNALEYAEPPTVITPNADLRSKIPNEVDYSGRHIMYQNLINMLFEEISMANENEENLNLYNTLREYSDTLSSLDSVACLLRSQEFRANLLQIVEALDLSDDPRVRKALREDESDLADILHTISQTDDDRRAVLNLEGDEAQRFLDVVQDVLDRGYLLDHADGLRARRLLVRLSESCDKLPSSLFIKGVRDPDAQASFGGGFGDVYRASYNGSVVALKRMRIFPRDGNITRMRRRFCREVLLWQHLKCPFIVPFLGIDAETFPTFLCMVSPWMRHGTVLKHLAGNGRHSVNKHLFEITKGLQYLHSQSIVHGDLRGSNILINDKWEACLTDFGLTVFNDGSLATYTSTHQGSTRWMAPELHFPSQFGLDTFRLTHESDIYAFGCVCVELYTGRAPFHDVSHDPAVMLKVVHGERPPRPNNMLDQLWLTVEMCWAQQYTDRPKIDELVEAMTVVKETRALPAPDRSLTSNSGHSNLPSSISSAESDRTITIPKTEPILAQPDSPPSASVQYSRILPVPSGPRHRALPPLPGQQMMVNTVPESRESKAVQLPDMMSSAETEALPGTAKPQECMYSVLAPIINPEILPPSILSERAQAQPDFIQEVESAFGSDFRLDDFSIPNARNELKQENLGSMFHLSLLSIYLDKSCPPNDIAPAVTLMIPNSLNGRGRMRWMILCVLAVIFYCVYQYNAVGSANGNCNARYLSPD